MKNYSTGFGLVLLLVTGLLVAMLGKRLFKAEKPESDRRSVDHMLQEEGAAESGEERPSTTKARVKDPVCKSNCEAVVRTCRGVAEGPEAKVACDRELTACLGACR